MAILERSAISVLLVLMVLVVRPPGAAAVTAVLTDDSFTNSGLD